MKVKDYYLAGGGEGQDRLEAWQREQDYYNTLSPEQEQAELDNDPGFQEFLDEIEGIPF